MKKVLSILLAAVMLFALCACGKPSQNTQAVHIEESDPSVAPVMTILDGNAAALYVDVSSCHWVLYSKDGTEKESEMSIEGPNALAHENKILAPKMYLDEASKRFSLSWGEDTPDEITVEGWSLDVFDDPQGAGTYSLGSFGVTEAMDEEGNVIPGRWNVEIMANAVYRISAKWLPNESESYGEGEYSFVTEGTNAAAISMVSPTAAPIVGGWSRSDSAEVTDGLRGIFDAAAGGEESPYTPIAYLAYQVVAGRNHCFLAQVANSEDESVSYALLYMYEALDGTVKLTGVTPVDLNAQDLTADELAWIGLEAEVVEEEAAEAADAAEAPAEGEDAQAEVAEAPAEEPAEAAEPEGEEPAAEEEDKSVPVDLLAAEWHYESDTTVPEEIRSIVDGAMVGDSIVNPIALLATATVTANEKEVTCYCILMKATNGDNMLLFFSSNCGEEDAPVYFSGYKLLDAAALYVQNVEVEEAEEPAEAAESEEGAEAEAAGPAESEDAPAESTEEAAENA